MTIEKTPSNAQTESQVAKEKRPAICNAGAGPSSATTTPTDEDMEESDDQTANAASDEQESVEEDVDDLDHISIEGDEFFDDDVLEEAMNMNSLRSFSAMIADKSVCAAVHQIEAPVISAAAARMFK